MMLRRVDALVPVKSLGLCKSRLSPVLNSSERADLQLDLLDGVLQALAQSRFVSSFAIVTSDLTVSQFALAAGAKWVAEPNCPGLNAAVTQGCQQLVQDGSPIQMVLPADLPLITAQACDELIVQAANSHGFAIAPDIAEEGTNALLFPSHFIPRFNYGPGSYKKHLAQLPKDCARVNRIEFSLDIDTPADLTRLNTGNSSRGLVKWMA